MDPETLREEEALRVTQAFGVDETEFLHFPDGKIEVNETTETALKEIIKSTIQILFMRRNSRTHFIDTAIT